MSCNCLWAGELAGDGTFEAVWLLRLMLHEVVDAGSIAVAVGSIFLSELVDVFVMCALKIDSLMGFFMLELMKFVTCISTFFYTSSKSRAMSYCLSLLHVLAQ